MNFAKKQITLTLIVFCMIFLWQSSLAQVPDISMSRDTTLIAWSTGGPLAVSYKDVQSARDPDGALLLYIPVTRAAAGNRFDTIYIWDASSGEFVDQSATLLPFINPAIDRGTYDVDFVDIDGDLDFDIVHSSPHGNRIYVNRRNEASGAFTDETSSRLPVFMTSDGVNIWDDVTTGDVDGDGDLDLMFSNRNFSLHPNPESNWGPNVLAYNDSTGHFGLSGLTRSLFGQAATLGDGSSKLEGASHGSKFADFNNDGRMDLVISHLSNYEFGGGAAPDFEIMINLGDPDADGLVNWQINPVTQNGKLRNVGIFDFNDDGQLDLYLARGGSNDEILTGNGDGTFDAPVEVQSLSGGVNSNSYDVAFGDFNNDDQMDIVTINSDGGSTENHLYLNDRNNPDPASRLFVSNATEFNPAAEPFGMLSAQPVDVDGDGDLDVILGAESRSAGREPLVIRNNLNNADAHSPKVEHPSLNLAAGVIPGAMFRVRIRDRVIDFDEIEAQLEWSTVGANGGLANGNQPLRWGGQMTYQSLLSCSDLRGGSFAPDEEITELNWAVSANDSVATNITIFDSDDLGAGNLLTQFQDSAGDAGISLNIIEPIGGGAVPIVNSNGSDVLFVRATLSPANLIPNLAEFRVQINGSEAQVLSVQKVGDQIWLAVQTPDGPSGVHDLEVQYSLCGLNPVSDTENNAVAYDDNPSNLDTVLVIDLSGSMNSDDKLAAAVNAGKLFVNTLRDQDRVGVVRYSGSSSIGATSLFNLTSTDNDGRAGAIDALNGLSASGCTPLGAGLEQGLLELDNLDGQAANSRRSLVLLSDGRENIQPFWDIPPSFKCSNDTIGPKVSEAFNTINTNADSTDNVRIDTVALGPNASIGLMTNIAFATGGVARQVLNTSGTVLSARDRQPFSIIDTAYAQQASSSEGLGNSLADVYENFHNGLSGQERLAKTIDTSKPRSIKRDELSLANLGEFAAVRDNASFTGRVIDVSIPENFSFATVAANWEVPRDMEALIIPPSGLQSGAIQVSRASTNAVFRINNPVAGVWRIVLVTQENFRVLTLLSGESQVSAFARSLTKFTTGLVGNRRFDRPLILQPGDAAPIALMLVGDKPVTGASVTAIASSSANGIEEIQLVDDGEGYDQAARDGIYTGVIANTAVGGTIDVEILSRWQDGVVEQQRSTPLSIEFAERDSDGDSISDVIEPLLGLDLNDPLDAFADPDRDGVPNWKEIAYSLDLNNSDTDGGGVSDGEEIKLLGDPEDGSDDEQALVDDDADGMSTNWEVAYGLDPNDPSDADKDLDGDGLTNLQEFELGTTPNAFDTDRDGVNDNDEVEAETDPTDPINRATGIDQGGNNPDVVNADKHHFLYLVCMLLLALLVILLIWILLTRRRS